MRDLNTESPGDVFLSRKRPRMATTTCRSRPLAPARFHRDDEWMRSYGQAATACAPMSGRPQGVRPRDLQRSHSIGLCALLRMSFNRHDTRELFQMTRQIRRGRSSRSAASSAFLRSVLRGVPTSWPAGPARFTEDCIFHLNH
jgi:hypothetical protein